MPKSVEVELGEQKYIVPMLTIGQLERIQDEYDAAKGKPRFSLLKIALERAEPKVDIAEDIAATRKQIKTAQDKIMKLCGFDLVVPDPNVKAPADQPGESK
jgi:hypothetical protein